MRDILTVFLPLMLGLFIYAYVCENLNFTQDDAYISYRYVANYLNGDGLVFNVGERVEGYTNFGWVIYLILSGALGLGYIAVSKMTGFIFGAGVIVVTYFTARLVFDRESTPFVWLAVYLVVFNLSLAYWSPAGLETAAFSFFAFLSVYLYLRKNWALIVSLTLATLLRPEGVLVAGLLVIIESIEYRRWPHFSFRCAAVAALLLVPMAVFKVAYYGSLLPNPFYAKTALSVGKLLDGLEYTGRFVKHYGFLGAGLVIPVLFYRKLSVSMRAVWLFMVLYTLYIVLIGGDVLKVHRFFLPLFGLSAILIAMSLSFLTARLASKTRYLVVFLVALPLIYVTFMLPRDFVRQYNTLERAFTRKMNFVAGQIAARDTSNFSVALPTIGIFGYQLLGHPIIDMLGLTDSTIARHSEPEIPGMSTTWKEKKHNSRYLLARKPDYILFSTGVKPSAPAEKALLVYRHFQDAYRTIGWYYQPDPRSARGIVQSVFRRVADVEGEIRPTYPIEYVEYYKLGLDCYMVGDHLGAIAYFDSAIAVSPEPVYIYLQFHKAFRYVSLNEHARAVFLLDEVLARDSMIFMAHAELYKYASLVGDSTKAAIHHRWLEKLVPWYLPRVEQRVERLMERLLQSQGN